MIGYCEAKHPVWIYWLQDQVTFSCDFQVYYYTEKPTQQPGDHDKWVRAGYSFVYLEAGEGIQLEDDNHDNSINEILVKQFPEVFELKERT